MFVLDQGLATMDVYFNSYFILVLRFEFCLFIFWVKNNGFGLGLLQQLGLWAGSGGFGFLFCLLSGKMGLDQAEQLYSSLYFKFTYYSKRATATVPLHLVSEFITKLSFNIPVQYKFVSTSEAYKIAKIIPSAHLMFLIFTNQ